MLEKASSGIGYRQLRGSTVVLIFAAPQLAAFALSFGPIETFALILLDMTCIVSVSGGSMVKVLSTTIGDSRISQPGWYLHALQ